MTRCSPTARSVVLFSVATSSTMVAGRFCPFVVKRTIELPCARYLVMGLSGQMVEYPSDSAWPGRLAVVLYTNDGGDTRCLYSNDQGATWTFSAEMPIVPGRLPNGNNLVLLPDVRLLCLNRISMPAFPNEPDNIRTANTSVDDGATWGPAFEMSNYRGALVSGGIVQVDLQGGSGAFGRFALSRATFFARAGSWAQRRADLPQHRPEPAAHGRVHGSAALPRGQLHQPRVAVRGRAVSHGRRDCGQAGRLQWRERHLDLPKTTEPRRARIT